MAFTEDRSVLSRTVVPPDASVTYGALPEHVADVRFGDERAIHRPLVLIVHGGFWRPEYDRAHTGPMAVDLAREGWTVAAIEYRRVPGQPDATIDDVREAIASLPEKIAKHDGRVLVMGHSAGGHLALWAASARPTEKLIGALALGPAADLRLAHSRGLGDGAALAFLGVDPEQRADLDPKRMPSPQIKTTIVHGIEDEIVPVALAESYVESHPQVKLLRLRDAGHFAVIDPHSPVFRTVRGELESLRTLP
jgi:acetyl esterase/lipase